MQSGIQSARSGFHRNTDRCCGLHCGGLMI